VQPFFGRGSSATAGAGRDGWLRAEERRADVSSQATAAVQADGGSDSSGQREQASRTEPMLAARPRHEASGDASGLPLHVSSPVVSRTTSEEGSSVDADGGSLASHLCGSMQKITQQTADGSENCALSPVNHNAMMSNDWQAEFSPGGFSVTEPGMSYDAGLDSKKFDSNSNKLCTRFTVPLLSDRGLNNESLFISGSAKDCNVGMVDEVRVVEANKHELGGRIGMGVASSPQRAGKPSLLISATANNSCSLSLIETNDQTHYPSLEEVIGFGGIQKPNAGVRSSTRLGSQPNADMSVMEKAMKQTMIKDDALTSGQLLTPKYSITNISDTEIAKRADRLGVSLGKSKVEIEKSIRGLKLVEEERILTMLQKNECHIDKGDEGLETLVLSKVSNLCEDLCEEEDIPLDFDDHIEHLKPVVKVKKIRQRKVYDTTNIRKSTRKRIKKQY
jgi:hypothetical protein